MSTDAARTETAIALGAVVAAACVVARPQTGVLATVGLASLTALLLVHRQWLWGLMLFVVTLVPLPEVAATSGISLTPLLAVPVVLLVRHLVVAGPTAAHRLAVYLLLLLTVWLGITVLHSVQTKTSLGWLVYFVLLVVVPALVGSVDRSAHEGITYAWVLLAGVLGAYAVIEGFVLHSNPLFDAVYLHARASVFPIQHWSVYRATTVFSQPVAAGVFLAVAVPLSLGRLLRRPSILTAAATIFSIAGLVATASRAASLGALAGALLCLLLPSRDRARHRVRSARVLAACLLLTAIAFGGWYLTQRSGTEVSNSAKFRHVEVPLADTSIHEHPLGVGAGVASVSQRPLLKENGGAGAFESIWLELAVGAGVPGLVLGAAVLIATILGAVRARAPAIAGGLVAWTVSATAYNALEGSRPALLYFGLLLAAAFSARADTAAVEAPRAAAPASPELVPAGQHA